MPQPPQYVDSIPTLYDETHRGRWVLEPEIASMGQVANMTGHLEHCAPTTDGSFAICMAGGSGNFVSQVSRQLHAGLVFLALFECWLITLRFWKT
jgi:hypothetical protein